MIWASTLNTRNCKGATTLRHHATTRSNRVRQGVHNQQRELQVDQGQMNHTRLKDKDKWTINSRRITDSERNHRPRDEAQQRDLKSEQDTGQHCKPAIEIKEDNEDVGGHLYPPTPTGDRPRELGQLQEGDACILRVMHSNTTDRSTAPNRNTNSSV